MTRHIDIPAAHQKTLAEARADFTAEGAPPPGVAGASSSSVRRAVHDTGPVPSTPRPILHLPPALRRGNGARA